VSVVVLPPIVVSVVSVSVVPGATVTPLVPVPLVVPPAPGAVVPGVPIPLGSDAPAPGVSYEPLVPVPLVSVPIAPGSVRGVVLVGVSRSSGFDVSSRRHPTAAVVINAANKAERVNDMTLLLSTGKATSMHVHVVESLLAKRATTLGRAVSRAR
jgi:hypothetical protein